MRIDKRLLEEVSLFLKPNNDLKSNIYLSQNNELKYNSFLLLLQIREMRTNTNVCDNIV